MRSSWWSHFHHHTSSSTWRHNLCPHEVIIQIQIALGYQLSAWWTLWKRWTSQDDFVFCHTRIWWILWKSYFTPWHGFQFQWDVGWSWSSKKGGGFPEMNTSSQQPWVLASHLKYFLETSHNEDTVTSEKEILIGTQSLCVCRNRNSIFMYQVYREICLIFNHERERDSASILNYFVICSSGTLFFCYFW